MSFEFQSKSINDFKNNDYREGRVAREVAVVVLVECANGTWCELDADNALHGEALAQAWVENHNARGCSVWPIEKTVILLANQYLMFMQITTVEILG